MVESVIENDSSHGHYVDVDVMQNFHDEPHEPLGVPEEEEGKSPVRKEGITRAKVILAFMFLLLVLAIVYYINKALNTVTHLGDRNQQAQNQNISLNAEPVSPSDQPIISNFNIIPVKQANENPAAGQQSGNLGLNTSCTPGIAYPCLR